MLYLPQFIYNGIFARNSRIAYLDIGVQVIILCLSRDIVHRVIALKSCEKLCFIKRNVGCDYMGDTGERRQ